MVKQLLPADLVFHALSDPRRRQIVERLSMNRATVSDIAAPLPISLAAVLQHIHILEAAGLVETTKVGRVRTCQLNSTALTGVETWLVDRRTAVSEQLERLDALLTTLDEPRNTPTQPSRKEPA